MTSTSHRLMARRHSAARVSSELLEHGDGVFDEIAWFEEDSTDDINVGSSYGKKPVRREGELSLCESKKGRP